MLDTWRRTGVINLNKENKQRTNMNTHCMKTNVKAPAWKSTFLLTLVACITDFPNIALSHAHPVNYLLKLASAKN